MDTVSEVRKEFEKLPQINRNLRYCRYYEPTDDYEPIVSHDEEYEWFTSFVNGAWESYQHQQKVIDILKEKLDVYERVDCALVPKEPTVKMMEAAYNSIVENLHYADIESIYYAMINVGEVR